MSMKAVGVLAFLAVVITQGAGQWQKLFCKTTDDYGDPDSITFEANADCADYFDRRKRDVTFSYHCKRPAFVNGKYLEAGIWGCLDAAQSPCTGGSRGNTDCVPCATGLLCNTEPIKCKTGSASQTLSMSTERCSDHKLENDAYEATVVCSRPMLDYGGYASDVAFGCGPCTDDNRDKTCKECSGDECNAKLERSPHHRHVCFKYEWNTNSDKFVKGDLAECNRGENPKLLCNMPKEDAEEADYTTVSGCGPCTNGEACEECDTGECNSAAMKAATALLLPLLALCYTMI